MSNTFVKMESEGNDIIACGPTLPAGNGLLKRRVVLKEKEHEFVTHIQVWHEDGETDFSNGHYFQKTNDNALKLAVDDFHDRMLNVW